MLEIATTTQGDLRGGRPPWSEGWSQGSQARLRPPVTESMSCEVLVVGAGITGSLAAEHLASKGRDVCVIDRERPGYGSTAASTAMLQWEIDKSLSDLTALYGFELAADVYRRSQSAVAGLANLIIERGLNCGLRRRQSLYIAAGETGAKELLAEYELRQQAGLPGTFLDHRTLLSEYDIAREAAILSPGSADADPLLLSKALLSNAVSQGAKLFDAEASKYDESGAAVCVEVDSGFIIEAKHVVLATGYVMPEFVKCGLHQVVSSWAIATPPQAPGALWKDEALIWEASKHYHYLRTMIDGSIIMGGEDDETIVEPHERDAAMRDKAKTLCEKLKALIPKCSAQPKFVWSGAFGTTPDGLPLIGPVPNYPRIHAAYGYGGNGITFSYLASRMIAASIAGEQRAWFDHFAIDREPSKYSVMRG